MPLARGHRKDTMMTAPVVPSQTANVKVFEPCTCAMCARNEPWFKCLHPILLAEYDCTPINEFDSMIPLKECVDEIKKTHPGKWLVYIDLKGYHDA
jgi:hypothetical protein